MIVVPAVIFMLFVTLGRSSPRTSSLFSHTKTFLKRFPLYCSSSPISSAPSSPKNFIKAIIEADIAALKNDGRVLTRFPPEPNGYLHLGHAKSICFNFGVAKEYNGATNMRFDDTNPAKEDIEYVNSILTDVKWLVGASSSSSSSNGEGTSDAVPWNGPVRHASDYFQTIYDAAIYLIETGQAYVDDSTPGPTNNLTNYYQL